MIVGSGSSLIFLLITPDFCCLNSHENTSFWPCNLGAPLSPWQLPQRCFQQVPLQPAAAQVALAHHPAVHLPAAVLPVARPAQRRLRESLAQQRGMMKVFDRDRLMACGWWIRVRFHCIKLTNDCWLVITDSLYYCTWFIGNTMEYLQPKLGISIDRPVFHGIRVFVDGSIGTANSPVSNMASWTFLLVSLMIFPTEHPPTKRPGFQWFYGFESNNETTSVSNNKKTESWTMLKDLNKRNNPALDLPKVLLCFLALP